jgi:hypothetical protein
MSNISPDVTAYTNLTLYDADPVTLVNRMVLNGQVSFPGWNPLQGNTELVLAQSLALIIAELVYAVNRLPGATVSTLLQLFGITQYPGVPATATVTFNMANGMTNDIPAGTQLQLVLPSQVVVFTTDTDTPIAGGVTAVTVDVTATTNVSAPNGAPVGTPLTPINQLWFVNSAVLATSPTGGQNPETNQAWLDRGINRLQGLSTALVTPDQFTTAALADIADTVFRATTVDNWNPTLSGGAGGTAEGCVTVAVLAEGGVELTTGQLGNVQAILDESCVAGLAVYVVSPQVTSVDVTCTVWQAPGYTAAQVIENVTASLAAPVVSSTGGVPGAGLSTDQWAWGQPVRLNDLITVITQTAGVDYVVSISSPSADVELTGYAPLAALGTVTVTVNGP